MSLISSQHHSFDIKLAAIYGIECALLIHHFQHWIRINRSRGRNLIDGRCWTYQTRKDIQAYFPYWTYEQVKHLCEKLVQMGILITANYNKRPIDRTLWYAFADEKAFGVDEQFSNNVYEKGNLPNALGKSPPPIPDTKERYVKEENIQKKDEDSADADLLATFLLTKIKEKKPNFTGKKTIAWIDASKKLLKLRSKSEIGKVIEYALNDDFWFPLCLSPQKLLKHLDSIEMQMTKPKTSPQSKSPVAVAEENKKLAQDIEKRFPDKIKSHDITICNSYIEFRGGSYHNGENCVKFTDPSFRDRVLNFLRNSLRLPVYGL